MTRQPILIIGAGGIGGVIGAHLLDQGETVVLVDKNAAHIDAIKRNGLQIVGVRPLHGRPAALHPGETEGQFSRVILAVKAKDTGSALDLVEDRVALSPAIAALTRGWSRDSLLTALEIESIPAGPINSVADALTDPQVAARGMLLDLGEGLKGLRTPIRFSSAELAPGNRSPRLGES